MDRQQINLLELLEVISPSTLDYQEWVNVGMALKHEGYTAYDWDKWSARDPARYHPGECYKKWDTFDGYNGRVITGATITKMAKDRGYTFSSPDEALDWNSTIEKDEKIIIDHHWIERQEITEPVNWNPKQEIITYLETLFESTENVGYVTGSWERDGKYMPQKGNWDRTAGQLIEELNTQSVEEVFGTTNEKAGAWIRFNPLDGQGVKNSNVTDFRYALVESDTMDLGMQRAIIKELELPAAVVLYSGGKSIHAIVKIEAGNYDEYRKRVNYLYEICQKNGLKIDNQNRNPSRLSRFPGFERNGKKQFIIETNAGKSSWAEWYEWIEGVNDDLPEPEHLEDLFDNLPELAPPLIEGVLRQGHKLLMAGPSKAGKSYALIELCIAIAEGMSWLGFNCAQGRILYVNLELDRASCLHRFKDVYEGLGLAPNNVKNIDIWNLRGKSVPMDKLAPKLIRRAAKKDYIAIVIDPIYKVITGDENSADQMAHFCNQFDKVCTDLGSAVIYCHHHSKGAQGGKKSMDRASGSGVFARDPDALLDLAELEVTDALLQQQENKAICEVYSKKLKEYNEKYYIDNVGQDDELSAFQMKEHINKAGLNFPQKQVIDNLIMKAKEEVKAKTAWRIEGTLREFPKFKPVNLWFEYPIHKIDQVDVLKDIQVDTGIPNLRRANSAKKTKVERKKERIEELEMAYNASKIEGEVHIKDLSEYMDVTEKTVRNRIKEHRGFEIIDNVVHRKSEGK